MFIIQFHAKHGIWQRFHNGALNLYFIAFRGTWCLVFGLRFNIRVVINVLALFGLGFPLRARRVGVPRLRFSFISRRSTIHSIILLFCRCVSGYAALNVLAIVRHSEAPMGWCAWNAHRLFIFKTKMFSGFNDKFTEIIGSEL